MNKQLENILSLVGVLGIIILMIVGALVSVFVGRYLLLWTGFWNVPTNIVGIFVSFMVGSPIVGIAGMVLIGLFALIYGKIKR